MINDFKLFRVLAILRGNSQNVCNMVFLKRLHQKDIILLFEMYHFPQTNHLFFCHFVKMLN